MASIMTAPIRPLSMTKPTVRTSTRLASIDALRGFVMLLMLLDHVRETFLLWVPVADPVDATTTDPAYFFTRLTSTLCAPVFVALTGLSAYLYSQRHSRTQTSAFLLKRGAFLILLELTLVNFVWRAQFPPTILYLQVIWAIGLSMIVLATLIHLPHKVVAAIGIGIVAGHNLLDPVTVAEGHPLHLVWSLLHDRAMVTIQGFPVRFSYPVLPWFGVIALGWTVGPWFASGDGATRRNRLVRTGALLLVGFILLRALNIYGDAPWFVVADAPLRTAMSVLALTKYPPSLLFLMSTLGVGLLLLALFERVEGTRAIGWLAVFGGAPMFFYLFHLYILRGLYLLGLALWGTNHGTVFGLPSMPWIWGLWIALIVPLYFPTRWFAGLKQRRKDIGWLKYF